MNGSRIDTERFFPFHSFNHPIHFSVIHLTKTRKKVDETPKTKDIIAFLSYHETRRLSIQRNRLLRRKMHKRRKKSTEAAPRAKNSAEAAAQTLKKTTEGVLETKVKAARAPLSAPNRHLHHRRRIWSR
jgi:hypothetical protein